MQRAPLRPLAGPFAEALFALGIVGTGLLAVPVLAGSAAYGVGEAFRWPTGLRPRAEGSEGVLRHDRRRDGGGGDPEFQPDRP